MKNSDNRKKSARVNNGLIITLLITCVAITGAFIFNIVRIVNADSGEGETVKSEQKETNGVYTIGNNPTAINKEYYDELTKAVNALTATSSTDSSASAESTDSAEATAIPAATDETSVELAQALVKTFVTEYYTWTNKDGNYDIGGIQYIFVPKQSDFEEYTLDNFYVDMDLYLSQYGRDNLMQVKDVTVESAAIAADYTVALPADTSEVSDGAAAVTETLPCIEIVVNWTYEDNATIDVTQFQNRATFEVVNNGGRWEIAAIQ